MLTQNIKQNGIPRGNARDSRPYGLRNWEATDALAAIGFSDDFFAVFPSGFPSVNIFMERGKRYCGISERLFNYLGSELYPIFYKVFEKFELNKFEFYIRNIQKLSTMNATKKEVRVELKHVQCDILRCARPGLDDDYDLCKEIAAYIYAKHKILAREMQRFYFDLKYETIYGIYRDCAPNPCKSFFIFDNNDIWGVKHAWSIPCTGKHFKNIKAKKF